AARCGRVKPLRTLTLPCQKTNPKGVVLCVLLHMILICLLKIGARLWLFQKVQYKLFISPFN
ncbi:hypothetical protein, partial [Alloprevotella tannerae]|uniref:hypothetical protein n=1 Tax=Alloprevotella tannerae TaxID=76122 RepID=UPI0028D2E5F4